jgi:hypothetical protein
MTTQNNNLVSVDYFHVTFRTATSSENVYAGFDFEEAKYAFDSYTVSNDDRFCYNMTVELEKQTNVYEFIGTLDEENEETIEDYLCEIECKDTFRLVEEGDFEEVESRYIATANEESDELLSDVERHFKNMYGNYKYNVISVCDKSGDEKGKIQLRIADHTSNNKNNDKYNSCNYYLSVVICDVDVTRNKFGIQNIMDGKANELELSFNSGDDFDNVIEEIENQIGCMMDMILDQ